MADDRTALPVMSPEEEADQRVQVKVVDATSPDANQMLVDSDGNAHTKVHGDNPAAGDETLRLSELGAPNSDGIYDGTNNTKPAHSGLALSSRDATPDDAHQTLRGTGIAGDNDKLALDVAISDSSGNNFSISNPLPVSVEASAGDEVVEPLTSAALAKDATVNLDYTVSVGKTLQLEQAIFAASGACKYEIQLETAPASGTYGSSDFVVFTSASEKTFNMDLKRSLDQVAGAKVRVAITNLDNKAFDVYTTLVGLEV